MTGVDTDPRTSRCAGGARRDRTVEPATLFGGRIRSARRGRVPRGRDPEEPTGPPESAPACIDGITSTYFRSEVGGLTLIGDFWGKRGADPDSFPQSASTESLASLVERTSHRVPALAEAGIWRSVTGVYDVSPDFRPLIGEVPGRRGLYVAAGFSGMGFKISPAVGLCLSELILDGRARTIDLTCFAPDRFATRGTDPRRMGVRGRGADRLHLMRNPKRNARHETPWRRA